MPTVYWDVETYSQISLKDRGAYIYARRSVDRHILLLLRDRRRRSAGVETWRSGSRSRSPIPPDTSSSAITGNSSAPFTQHILVPRYGFPPLPIEQSGLRRSAWRWRTPIRPSSACAAKRSVCPIARIPEARKAMLRLSRPQTAKKRKKKTDDAPDEARERDLALLLERCKIDVVTTRAATTSPLRPLLPEERRLLLLDAKINARGVCANVPFLEAVRTLAVQERNAVNIRLNELTAGVITSVDQVNRIMEAVNKHGHGMTSLNKRSVAAVLAHQPDDFVRELLELRQRGAFASAQKFKKLLAFADPDDHRIRGALRIYGAGPGRWSSDRSAAAQPAAQRRRAAVLSGQCADRRRPTPSSPASVTRSTSSAELSRAALCAAPGHVLICADFSCDRKPRSLAWLAGETWKLDDFRQYDATGDKNARALSRARAPDAEQEQSRQRDHRGRAATRKMRRAGLRIRRSASAPGAALPATTAQRCRDASHHPAVARRAPGHARVLGTTWRGPRVSPSASGGRSWWRRRRGRRSSPPSTATRSP